MDSDDERTSRAETPIAWPISNGKGKGKGKGKAAEQPDAYDADNLPW